MDYIRSVEIELEKKVYFPGDKIRGNVIINASNTLYIKAIKIILRGKIHLAWQIKKKKDNRKICEERYLIDRKIYINQNKNKKNLGRRGSIYKHAFVIEQGKNAYHFTIVLPFIELPYSYESEYAWIRYYIRASLECNYGTPAQYLKYLTLIGPKCKKIPPTLKTNLKLSYSTKRCFSCFTTFIKINVYIEKSIYMCGEEIEIKIDVSNMTKFTMFIKAKLIQKVDYFINKGFFGYGKEIYSCVTEKFLGKINPMITVFDKKLNNVMIPVVPPTLIQINNMIEVVYSLRVYIYSDSIVIKQFDFPIHISATDFNITNSHLSITYDFSIYKVEGGGYVHPLHQNSNIYDGQSSNNKCLYSPVYMNCKPKL